MIICGDDTVNKPASNWEIFGAAVVCNVMQIYNMLHAHYAMSLVAGAAAAGLWFAAVIRGFTSGKKHNQ